MSVVYLTRLTDRYCHALVKTADWCDIIGTMHDLVNQVYYITYKIPLQENNIHRKTFIKLLPTVGCKNCLKEISWSVIG